MEEENKVEESVTEQAALDTAEETTTEEVVEETKVTEEVTSVEDAKEEIKKEENIAPVEENNNTVKEDKKKDKKKYNTFRTIAVILIIILIILLLCFKCGNGKKYKIILHNGDEIIEVDENFKLSDLEVEGGIVSFLVDSDGHIVDPSKKLDPKKEYSTHIIPEGKEKVKVTYVNGEWSLTVEYQKGAGLLFPADPTKSGYIFIGWKDEDADDYPIFMTPVNHDMTLVAQFGKSESKGGKCTLNCDTDGDGKCDLNCDTNGDGKPDTNIDLDGDGKCDLNCDADGDGKCDYKCDTDGDGACDLDCDELKQMDRSGKKKYDCAEDPNELTIVPFLNKTSSVLSATLDDEKVEPIGYDEGIDKFGREYKNPIFALGKYNGSGKTHILKVDYYVHDETGNKYFLHFEYELFFKDNCDVKPDDPTPTDPDNPDEPDNPDNPEPSNPEPTSQPQPSETYTCPDGYTLNGKKCTKTVTIVKDAKISSYSCDSGYTLDGDKCKQNVEPVCPSGFEEYAGGCVYLTPVGYTNECDPNGLVQAVLNPQTGKCEDMQGNIYDPIKVCPATEINGKCGEPQNRSSKNTCPAGTTKVETATALICEKTVAASPNYSCSSYGSDYLLEEIKCTKTTTETINATKK